ncbi:MAG: hypothetical protein IT285_01690 [Bdellovibrionales bacterium]|nr:hypothetical protein [Bdellovibrionales bacterium]
MEFLSFIGMLVGGVGWTPVALVLLGGIGGAAAFRIVRGLRLSVYLVSREAQVAEHRLIPVTLSARKHHWLRALKSGSWRDDVELILMDRGSQPHALRVRYSLWRRYTVELGAEGSALRIGKRELKPGRRYPLRTGMKLIAGDRPYEIVVSPEIPGALLRF